MGRENENCEAGGKRKPEKGVDRLLRKFVGVEFVEVQSEGQEAQVVDQGLAANRSGHACAPGLVKA